MYKVETHAFIGGSNVGGELFTRDVNLNFSCHFINALGKYLNTNTTEQQQQQRLQFSVVYGGWEGSIHRKFRKLKRTAASDGPTSDTDLI